jgi:hypothetical protein
MNIPVTSSAENRRSPPSEALDRKIRIDVAERIRASLQLVVVLGESVIELLAEFQADQAGRRRVDGQLGKEVE